MPCGRRLRTGSGRLGRHDLAPVQSQGSRTTAKNFCSGGLLTCGSCGGGYTIIGADRYGCAATRSKGTSGNGTCRNRTTITKQAIEARVLSGIKDRMLAPELVAAFVTEFAAECARLNRDRAGEDAKLNKGAGRRREKP